MARIIAKIDGTVICSHVVSSRDELENILGRLGHGDDLWERMQMRQSNTGDVDFPQGVDYVNGASGEWLTFEGTMADVNGVAWPWLHAMLSQDAVVPCVRIVANGHTFFLPRVDESNTLLVGVWMMARLASILRDDGDNNGEYVAQLLGGRIAVYPESPHVLQELRSYMKWLEIPLDADAGEQEVMAEAAMISAKNYALLHDNDIRVGRNYDIDYRLPNQNGGVGRLVVSDGLFDVSYQHIRLSGRIARQFKVINAKPGEEELILLGIREVSEKGVEFENG